MNPHEDCPNDTDSVQSLALEIEELKRELWRVREFLNQQFDSCSCEHCGQILVRKHMLAPYGLDRGSDGKPLPQSSRWFCGYCVYAACVSSGGNQREIRERIGEWLARGYGGEFLAEMDSHFAHLGPGANHAPVAEHLRREFAAEIEKARQEEDDDPLHQCGGSQTRR
jgi:hypothetical protein